MELLKSSLQTFLNALTFPDKTCYPVASTNLRDFYNLVDVYIDAVFHPRIDEDVLRQEGWHIDVDEEGRWSYKGVVFNEMKGVYSSPDSVLPNLNCPTRFLRIWACPDNSSLAAALSCAVAEFVWTTLEIWSMPCVTCLAEDAWSALAAEISLMAADTSSTPFTTSSSARLSHWRFWCRVPPHEGSLNQ